VFGNQPGDTQIFHLFRGGLDFGGECQFLCLLPTDQVAFLHQQTAHNAADIILTGINDLAVNRTGFQQSNPLTPFLERANGLNRISIIGRRHNHFGKETRRAFGFAKAGIGFHNHRCNVLIHISIQGDNPAESTDHIPQIGSLIGPGNIGIHRTSAGIHVLDYHGGRFVKFLDQFKRGIGIHQVIETDGGSRSIDHPGSAHADFFGIRQAVERPLLMRIFAITKFLIFSQRDAEPVGKDLAGLFIEIFGYRCIIRSRQGKRLAGTLFAQFKASAAVFGFHLIQHLLIL